ncbi:MAG TPA: hemolysin family protein [Sedimentisphaerales bacterium]|nr:hemolysin family protein [Sedimentisphaerales bacterium]
MVYQNLGHITLMLALVLCSGFFSASETAFFNLSSRQTRMLRESRHRLQKLVAHLLEHPGRLLNSLLFGNMTVNVLYFSVSSVLVMRIKKEVGITAAGAAAFLSFALLVLAGEILPKSLAYASSRPMSMIAASPAYVWLKVFSPLQFVFKMLVLEPILRILLGPKRMPHSLTVAEFLSLIEATRTQGLITPDENRLLTEVVELGFLKVRHVMCPRVDMVACSAKESVETAKRLMLTNSLTKLPIYVGDIDNIVGLVHFRRLLLEPLLAKGGLDKLAEDVSYVPEQKTVESLLEFFRRSRSDTAVVVDEYGGIAGLVRLEHIAEHLFAQTEAAEGLESIEQTGPFEYRLAGSLAIHDWADAFGIDVSETRVCTVGGFVTAILGKMPKIGDEAQLKNLRFTVGKVRKHRIESLILKLEPEEKDGQ